LEFSKMLDPVILSQAVTEGSAAPATSATTAADGTGFKPVKGGSEMQSGEMLLVEAYAAIWVVVLAFVALAWSRNRKVEARIASLEGAIAKANREASRREAE
jgi:hypothetical protein